MKQKLLVISLFVLSGIFLFSSCSQQGKQDTQKTNFGGFESQVKWGEHLVLVGVCNDCHTPKKMGPNGPELDMSLMLSGHPSKLAVPDVNRKDLESKGYAVSSTFTAWIGPWGISYADNITSDPTGIGNWTEANFIKAIREGKYKGMEGTRPLLPPMPWDFYKYWTDDEIKAVFAYLKSTKPIQNIVPQFQPPVSAPPSK
jgi:hypothetical protein